MEQLWEPNHPVNVYLRLPTVKYIQHGAYKIFCCGENMSKICSWGGGGGVPERKYFKCHSTKQIIKIYGL